MKKIVTVVLTIALALGLTGCSGGSSQSTASKVTLYWWRPSTDAPIETLNEIKSQFESEHSNIKIEIATKDIRTYTEEAKNALSAHATVENVPDILSLPAEDLPAWITALTPASDTLFESDLSAKKKTGKTSDQYVADLFEPAVVKSVTFNSSGSAKIYGLPMAMDTLALYLNKDILEKAAENLRTTSKNNLTAEELKAKKTKITTAPKTWQELADIIPYIKVSDGDNISQAAIALGTAENVERSYDILQAIMMQNKTKLTSDDLNSATFNQVGSTSVGQVIPGEEALKFYLRFSNPSDPLYTWNNTISDSSLNAFANSQTAMLIHYASAYSVIVNKAPSIKSSIDVAALPQIVDPTIPTNSSLLKTTARMMVETAPNAKADPARQQAAWTFIKYITSKSGASPYLSAMKLPSALKDQAGKAKFEAFANQKTYADVWYKGTLPNEVDGVFISMIARARTGTATKDAVDKANADVSAVLQKSLSKWATAASSSNSSQSQTDNAEESSE